MISPGWNDGEDLARLGHRQLVLAQPLGPLTPTSPTHDVVPSMGKGDQLVVVFRQVGHEQIDLAPGNDSGARIPAEQKPEFPVVRRGCGEVHDWGFLAVRFNLEVISCGRLQSTDSRMVIIFPVCSE